MTTFRLSILFALAAWFQVGSWILGGASSILLLAMYNGILFPDVPMWQVVGGLVAAFLSQGLVYHIGKQIMGAKA